MDEDDMTSKLYELERYLANDDHLPDDELIVDTDERIHRQEDEDAAPDFAPDGPARITMRA